VTAAAVAGALATVAGGATTLIAPPVTNSATVTVSWTPAAPEAVYGLSRFAGGRPNTGNEDPKSNTPVDS
jgi:hypothetical protein